MDKTSPSQPGTASASPDREATGRRSRRGMTRAHPLVASLAGGLQATFAADLDDAMPDRFARLIARLEQSGSNAV